MSREDELMKAVADDMAKSDGQDLSILRKYLGNKVVDTWKQAWASDKDLPDDAPDIVDDPKAYEGEKGLRKRSY